MKSFLIVILSLFCFFAQSQDTLTVMHYNLLMFGNNTGWCTQSNNNYITKTDNLKTIIEYVKPDIFTVNEISNSFLYHDYINNNALNVNGINYYQKGSPPNHSGSYIINQIYYNSEKLSLLSNLAIETSIRDIDIFKLNYTSVTQPEPVELNCIVAHLKAGSDYEDEVERANETNKLMNYLNNSSASGNYLMAGDFNVYTFSEAAFQNLILHSNEDIRFYDPISKLGSWNNNSYFASYHTQSTHTSSSCFSGGGMDDRFDFILVSDEVLYGTEKMKYFVGSYKALGQDGNHFNSSLISSPSNTSVPADVLNALYDMSDHLPIVMKLVIGDNLSVNKIQDRRFSVSFQNPVKDKLELVIKCKEPVSLTLEFQNLQGQSLYSKSTNIKKDNTPILIPVENLKTGIYFLKLTDETGFSVIEKIMKI